ncbi:MAG TPA: hypothetical protein VMF66_13245 [Candidatus Acidoferrum sp.]|nr:hypothetical protein [Candidatus Acidoferrum sp.]
MKSPVCALGLAVALTAHAAAAAHWMKLSSDNFQMYASGDEREARQTLVTFEQVRDFFMRVKSQTMTTTLPVTIVGFRGSKEYQPYRLNEFATAYYSGDDQRDYIVMSDFDVENTPIAIHEYMHLLVRHSGLKLPVWLNEGFADVYSTLKPEGSKVLLGSIPQGRALTLVHEKWMPLAQLVAVKFDSPEYNEKNRASIFYAQSWLLAHMLMLGADYRQGFTKFVAALQTGDADSAFEAAYHKKLWEVEVDLHKYADTRTWTGVLFNTQFEKIKIEPARPATDLEIGFALAKLLALIRRNDEAMARFAELEKQYPDNADIEEALGLLAWTERNREEALTHMKRAVELGPSNWQPYWEYARILGPRDQDAYTTALRKTLELKPDMLDARLALGSELYREQKWAQALVVLREAKNVEPKQATRLFLTLAYCSVQLDRNDEARKYAVSARKYAQDDQSRQRVDELDAYLNKQTAATPAPETVAATEAAPATGKFDVRPTKETLPPPAPPAPPKAVRVRGNFKRLDCVGEMARMHVTDGREDFVLLIRHPDQVSLKGGSPESMKCGPKNDEVSVDYTPGKDEKLGTIGEVVRIEIVE